ncbi:hypothetical protein LX59_02627 [Azomonas agilis]|uniref:Multidrug transporter n=1 Tax=Azomonas agilis TaxID=116849 RepID=A0A562HZM7_9GAMM|nr:multidrug transporter [Azomonas agilis]TWH64220.1 hypothetical protein LX59_02627 [Azomonas agilis]
MILSRVLSSALLVALISTSALAENISGDPVYQSDTPAGYSMLGDLLIARPLLIGATLIGSVAFVVSLPFSLASGSVNETAESLVFDPGREAFVRCLGCTKAGYKVQERD